MSDFPSSPSNGDQVTFNNSVYEWNGVYWTAKGNSGIVGATGATGATGAAGTTGTTGNTGAAGQTGSAASGALSGISDSTLASFLCSRSFRH